MSLLVPEALTIKLGTDLTTIPKENLEAWQRQFELPDLNDPIWQAVYIYLQILANTELSVSTFIVGGPILMESKPKI